jgi:hypothetical protein
MAAGTGIRCSRSTSATGSPNRPTNSPVCWRSALSQGLPTRVEGRRPHTDTAGPHDPQPPNIRSDQVLYPVPSAPDRTGEH